MGILRPAFSLGAKNSSQIAEKDQMWGIKGEKSTSSSGFCIDNL